MNLDLNRIYYFPELKEGRYSRKDLENILKYIFEFNRGNLDNIVDFLEKAYAIVTKKEALKILTQTVVDDEDFKNFIIEEEND